MKRKKIVNKNVNSHMFVFLKKCVNFIKTEALDLLLVQCTLDFEIESFSISVCTIEVCVIY